MRWLALVLLLAGPALAHDEPCDCVCSSTDSDGLTAYTLGFVSPMPGKRQRGWVYQEEKP